MKEQATDLAAGFAMEDAQVEYEVAQAEEMAKQFVILESIQYEAYVEANCHFIWQQRAEINELFASGLDNGEAELPHFPIYPPPGTEIVDISDDE